jgi:hypothetical protein
VQQELTGNLLITLANLALRDALLALQQQMDSAVLVQLVSLTYLVITPVPSILVPQTNI